MAMGVDRDNRDNGASNFNLKNRSLNNSFERNNRKT